MTVIRPNSITGITSITALNNTISVYKSDGTTAGLQLDGVNFNTTGVSTVGQLNATTLTVNSNNYPSAGPLSNRNLVINGAMQVAQRGTSSTTSGYGSVDRFFVQTDGGTVTHTQTAITSGTPYDEGFRNVLRLTNTATAAGASNIRNSFQYIEAQTIANSGWNYASSTSYVTLSFWVRSSVAQEFYGYLRSFDGTEQGYSFSLGSLSADTWTKVTKTIPGNSNLTFDNNNGAGLQVNISPFWGTNYTDAGNTVDTWGAFASGSRTPDYTNTWAGTTDATFDITGVQLEVGSVATPFEHRSYGEELALCQRYYWKTEDFLWLYSLDSGHNYVRCNIFHPVEMRTTPTVTGSFGNAGASNGFQAINKKHTIPYVNTPGSGLTDLTAGAQFSAEL